MALFVSGLSHRNAPVGLREQLAVDEDKLRELLRDVSSTNVVREAIVLSTCNRVEAYAVADVPGEARAAMFRRLCHHRGVEPTAVEAALYTFAEGDAVRHAFRVASSLLVEQGVFPVYVTNRTWARAQEMARALSGTAVPFDELTTALAAVDIVITSTGAPEPVIRREMVQRVMHGRRGRSLFFIDIAVPRDVDGAVDTLDDVYCYDIDDLKQVVDANIRERVREAHRAEALIEREVAKFLAKLGDVEVIPTIVSLRERLEAIRTGEVKRTLARLPGATPEMREAIEAMSTAIVNKILHAPITKLRESSRAGSPRSWLELVHELFGLGRRWRSRSGRGEARARWCRPRPSRARRR